MNDLVVYTAPNDYRNYLMHYGVKGMKWGERHDYVPTGKYRMINRKPASQTQSISSPVSNNVLQVQKANKKQRTPEEEAARKAKMRKILLGGAAVAGGAAFLAYSGYGRQLVESYLNSGMHDRGKTSRALASLRRSSDANQMKAMNDIMKQIRGKDGRLDSEKVDSLYNKYKSERSKLGADIQRIYQEYYEKDLALTKRINELSIDGKLTGEQQQKMREDFLNEWKPKVKELNQLRSQQEEYTNYQMMLERFGMEYAKRR